MIKEILNGWKNFLISNPIVEDIAKDRSKICSQCPSAKYGKHSAILKDYTTKEIEGYYCGECKCPLSVKVRSTISQCPLGKWKADTKS